MRNKLKNAKLIIVKIGTSSLTDTSGNLDRVNLTNITAQVAQLLKTGKKVVIVTSGAIATGASKAGLIKKPKSIPEKQATAAIGQILLMDEYAGAFKKHGITIAQMLLTRDAIEDRTRYVNARNTLLTLLELGVVPIINENDSVAIEEIKVGDNDNLAALVASLIGADILVMLTDIDGFYVGGKLVSEIAEITASIKKEAKASGSEIGTGGMITKLEAACVANDAGTDVLIVHGREPDVLLRSINGEKLGTLFPTKKSKLESKKRWIAHGLKVAGEIIIDTGAAKALCEQGKSLLAVGIKNIKGAFEEGSLIKITADGKELARGLTNYKSADIKKIKGKKTTEIESILGYSYGDEVIHRDNMVLLATSSTRE